MEKLGVLVVSKCLSAPAMVDALLRSDTYAPELYVVQKQANPYLTAKARAHAEVPDMGLDDIEDGVVGIYALKVVDDLAYRWFSSGEIEPS